MKHIILLSIVALLTGCGSGCHTRTPLGDHLANTNGPFYSGSITYHPATGEVNITGGITFHFGKEPSPATAATMRSAGMTQKGLDWIIPAVTNDIQRTAVNAALLEGATMPPPSKP